MFGGEIDVFGVVDVEAEGLVGVEMVEVVVGDGLQVGIDPSSGHEGEDRGEQDDGDEETTGDAESEDEADAFEALMGGEDHAGEAGHIGE